MDCFNHFNNANLYPTSSMPFGDFNTYPTQTSATEQFGDENPHTFTNGWNTDRQPGGMVGPSTGLRAEASFGSVSSATSHTTPAPGYDHPQHAGYYWPIVGQYARSLRSGIINRDNTFTSTVELEDATVIPTPSAPHNYWGTNESGPSTNMFQANIQTSYQPSTGLTRTGTIQTRRFQPYGTPRARSNEHTNAEAGPSSLAPPLVPYVAPPPANPSGGKTEVTADAENNQTTTEENAAPKTRRPRGTGTPRRWRLRYQQDLRRLCEWAQGREGLLELPTHERALGIALEAIQARGPIYSTPKLVKGRGKRTTQGNKVPDAEYRRRAGIREVNEQLSRYYETLDPQGWECPDLLVMVLREVAGPEPPATPPP